MRAVIQRVRRAAVTVEGAGEAAASIERGLCVLVGIARDDTPEDLRYIVRRLLNTRLFDDTATDKRWSLSVVQAGLQVLCLSQVTLYHKLKGNKPDFHLAMSPQESGKMFQDLVESLRQEYSADKVQSGVFGAYCAVDICNDGPVTLVIDSADK